MASPQLSASRDHQLTRDSFARIRRDCTNKSQQLCYEGVNRIAVEMPRPYQSRIQVT